MPIVCLEAGLRTLFFTNTLNGTVSVTVKSLIGGVCGYNARDRMHETEIVPLLSCTKNIASHESAFKFTCPEDEIDLILCRTHICRPLCRACTYVGPLPLFKVLNGSWVC